MEAPRGTILFIRILKILKAKLKKSSLNSLFLFSTVLLADGWKRKL